MGVGCFCVLLSTKLRIPVYFKIGSQSVGAKLHWRKGNIPDPRIRSLNTVKSKRKFVIIDSQEVGLEAAIL